MAEHNSLWVSCCATSVDNGAALAWSLLLNVVFDNTILDVLSELDELAERVNALILL